MNENPQKENGYTAIANEIMEALAKINLSAYEGRLVMAVLRKTYGWNKKMDYISISKLEEIMCLDRRNLSRTKRKLIARKILILDKNKIGFNKYYNQWDVSVETRPLVSVETHTGVSIETTLGVSLDTHTKEKNKTTNTKTDKSVLAIAEKSAMGKKDTKIKKQKPDKETDLEIIPDLLLDKQLHIQRIGLFAKFKGVIFKSKEHQAEFIKRNLRASRSLNAYSNEKIFETLIYLQEHADFKYTISTIGKYIDEDLSKLSNKTNNIIIG